MAVVPVSGSKISMVAAALARVRVMLWLATVMAAPVVALDRRASSHTASQKLPSDFCISIE